MNEWYMVTVVGEDRPGIVAKVTDALYQGDCYLGEASMMRLGNNFTIMLMVKNSASQSSLDTLLGPVAKDLNLHIHTDHISAGLHQHIEPDVQIRVSGSDRNGIIAQVTQQLTKAGLTILNLESDVAGCDDAPIYIMQIEGRALNGIEALQNTLADLSKKEIDISISPIDTLVG